MNRIRSMRHWSLLALLGASLVPVVVACGKDKPPETAQNVNTTPPPGGYPPGYPGAPTNAGTGTGYPSGPAPSGSQGPMGPVTSDPNGLQSILAGVAAAASAFLTPGGAPGDSGEAGLRQSAARVAPGMAPEGQMMKESVTEGGHKTMSLPMDNAHCYIVVGYSPPGGVKDLDLNLLMPPFFTTLAGQDASHHNSPFIAGQNGQPMCPLFNLGAYRLDIHAASGAGQVLVQLYSKAK